MVAEYTLKEGNLQNQQIDDVRAVIIIVKYDVTAVYKIKVKI